ncbi:MAG: transposase [Akkermansiaceae bacterium]
MTYQYLTNLSEKIPPGLIARLYKARWDIEKVFDEMKNKLEETKAWASSATAKAIQARLLCLTHNLMLLMEQEIEHRSGVKNTAELERRRKRRAKEKELAKKASKPQATGLLERTERLTQRAVKFVRWLRNHLNFQRDWHSAVASLAEIYSHI